MSRTKPGIGKLLGAMRKLVAEVNDQEICRKLEILMNSEKEDLPAQLAKKMIDDPGNFDARQAPEPYTQYVKHYLYMVKRERRDRENGRALESKARQTKSLRRTPKQQSSRRQSDPTKAPARSSQTSAAKTRKPGSIAEQAPGDSHPPEERN